jgi:hypothetical protein
MLFFFPFVNTFSTMATNAFSFLPGLILPAADPPSVLSSALHPT